MAQPEKIDVNAATYEELTRATGLRPALVDAILAHRAAKGPFATMEALLEVPGIGATRLEQLRAVLAAGVAAEAAETAAPVVSETATPAVAEPEPVPQPKVPVVVLAEAPSVEAAAAASVPSWLDLVAEELTETMGVWWKLVAARSWHEMMEIQAGYVLGSLGRSARLFQGVMAATLPVAGDEVLKRAA
jgi:competence ComEA-like helix-hairpin-helix protein